MLSLRVFSRLAQLAPPCCSRRRSRASTSRSTGGAKGTAFLFHRLSVAPPPPFCCASTGFLLRFHRLSVVLLPRVLLQDAALPRGPPQVPARSAGRAAGDMGCGHCLSVTFPLSPHSLSPTFHCRVTAFRHRGGGGGGGAGRGGAAAAAGVVLGEHLVELEAGVLSVSLGPGGCACPIAIPIAAPLIHPG